MENQPKHRSENEKRYYDDVRKLETVHGITLLTPEQEVELAERIKKGDPEARSHMIRANLRLVIHIAEDYTNYGLPLLDLISEGNIGLMKAVERFDPNKGGKFSTYAVWWIKQSIKKALANQSKTIRLPVHTVDKILQVRRVSMRMSEELGREPYIHEIAREVGIERSKLAHLMMVARTPMSINAIMESQGQGDGESDKTMGDRYEREFEDNSVASPYDQLVSDDLLAQLPQLRSLLDTEQKRRIIQLRFGLDGEKKHTLDDIGKQEGLTRERIRQLEAQALRAMYRGLRKQEKELPEAVRRMQVSSSVNYTKKPILTDDEQVKLTSLPPEVPISYGIHRDRLNLVIELLRQNNTATPASLDKNLTPDQRALLGVPHVIDLFFQTHLFSQLLHGYIASDTGVLKKIPWKQKPFLSDAEQAKLKDITNLPVHTQYSRVDGHKVQEIIDILAANPGISILETDRSHPLTNKGKPYLLSQKLSPEKHLTLYIRDLLK